MSSADKDEVVFVSRREASGPLRGDLQRLLHDVSPQPTSFLDDGRINIECPCLHSALAHRCGHLMRDAISCFNASSKVPRGSDCEELFMKQAVCIDENK